MSALQKSPPPLSWISLAWFTTLAAYLYVLNEWFFVVTKPSYVHSWSLLRKLELYLLASSLFACLACAPLILLYLAGRLPGMTRYRGRLIQAGMAVPAGIAAALALMMVDNFGYTMIRRGIVSTGGIGRVLFAGLFVFLLVYFYRSLHRKIIQHTAALARRRYRRWLVPGVAGVMLLSFAIPVATNEPGPGATDLTGGVALQQRPNILYVTSDGLEASHMSVYGYGRDTTPTLRELAASSLLAENAFTNAGRTAGSLISALTGRYPANTRVLYAPDVLHRQDAYLHLPGILRSAGYRTAQFSFPYYADVYGLNMLNGFDQANGRTFNKDHLIPKLANYLPLDFPYFIVDGSNRLLDRLRHIFFLKRMPNGDNIVLRNPSENMDGQPQVDGFIQFLDQSSQPFFVQMHLLGTHGPAFHFSEQVFSAGKDAATRKAWDPDFYDDSILGFDHRLAQMIEALKQRGLYDDTILIVGSDHGREWSTTRRLPLMIHFPGGRYAGKITANVHGLDVAPTLLDFLGVQAPAWMQGRSLLSPNLPPDEPLFAVSSFFPDEINIPIWASNPQQVISRYDPFEIADVIYCDRWYELNLFTGELTQGEVEGSTAGCSMDGVPDEQVRSWIAQHFEHHGYHPALTSGPPP